VRGRAPSPVPGACAFLQPSAIDGEDPFVALERSLVAHRRAFQLICGRMASRLGEFDQGRSPLALGGVGGCLAVA
jgi:hypothetical protein